MLNVPTLCTGTFNYSRENWDDMNIYFTEYNLSDYYGITNIEVAWEYPKASLTQSYFQLCSRNLLSQTHSTQVVHS